MSKQSGRTFSPAFKRRILERVAAGERVSLLASEIGVHRQLIYKWKDAARTGRLGRRRGPPTKAQALAGQAGGKEAETLSAAKRRIAELERKIGQQAFELDFFRGALRRIKASRLPSE